MHELDLIVNVSRLGETHWAYSVVFLGALLEAATPLGVFVPGGLVVILAAFFSKTMTITIGNVFLFAFLGAVAGDCLGYFFGRRYGYAFLGRYGKYFFIKSEWLERARGIIAEHAGKSIILGRFNPVTRAFAPFVVGVSHIPFKRFIFFSLVGSFLWAFSYCVLGYLFGAAHTTVARYIGVSAVIAIFVSFFFGYLYRLLSRQWHFFERYHLHLFIINIAALLSFGKITDAVLTGERLNGIDGFLHLTLQAYVTPTLTDFMVPVTHLGSVWFALPASLVLIAALVVAKERVLALTVFIAVGATTVSGFFLKHMFAVPRPEDALVLVPLSGSFPSGHAATATIFFGALLYALWRNLKNRQLEYLSMVLGVVLVFLISVSRLYLGVHWLSDVLGGVALGVFWLTFAILLERITAETLQRKAEYRETGGNRIG